MKILVRINGTGFAVRAAIEKLKEKNATLRAWTTADATMGQTQVVSKQSRSKYQRKHGFRGSWRHTPMIHSVADVVIPTTDTYRDRILRYELGSLTFDVVLPKGYEWRISPHGELYVLRPSNGDEYHVTGDELSDLSGKEIAAKLRETNATRRAMERKQKENERQSSHAAKRYSPVILTRRISRALAADATITLADSVAAGNCPAGTMQYAETLGVRDHVVPLTKIIDRPSEIRRVVAGEDVRLKNAIVKTIERQGF